MNSGLQPDDRQLFCAAPALSAYHRADKAIEHIVDVLAAA
jgi:hypothetical protein